MNRQKEELIKAIEKCIIISLNGHKGRSNEKTKLLHESIAQYINERAGIPIDWSFEEKLLSETTGQTFTLDILAKGNQKDVGLLLKAPTRSMHKNRYNYQVNIWGEAIRTALIRENDKKPLSVLSISVHPTTDITIKGKDISGKGSTKFKWYESDQSDYYNAGFDLIKSTKTVFRYVAISYEYSMPLTQKSLDGVLEEFERIKDGSRIKISMEIWKDFHEAIDWALDLLK